MRIKLKGKLPVELTDLGLMKNDEFHAYPPENGRATDVLIRFLKDGAPCQATVSEENYKKV
jgi:hypothetical protein